MIRIVYVLFLGITIFPSCNGLKNDKEDSHKFQNQLVVTEKGDSLENGFWTTERVNGGVSKSGNYKDGNKLGKWVYKMNGDSFITNWSVIIEKDVKFNFPDCFKFTNDAEPPTLFLADIDDDDDNTLITLLRYNLTELKSSDYDYLYEYNDVLKNNTEEKLKSKEFKKFYFKGIEMFRMKIQTEKKIKYEGISYIFVVNNILYELAYKNAIGKTNAINLEIFNDILYSMECENLDLFNYNNKQYNKEENIEFKSDTL